MRGIVRAVSLFLVLAALISYAAASAQQDDPLDRIQKRGYLVWGSDTEGGAPYVFPDPQSPSQLIGFEIDRANAIARELGVKAKQGQNAWDSLVPALERGDLDIAMNGIEITPQRQQRVAIVRALAMKPEAMLFDEPTSSLDPEMVGEVLSVIRELVNEGMTTVIATHEMDFAREIADQIVVFDEGEIIERGPPDAIFRSPNMERTKNFLSRVLGPR